MGSSLSPVLANIYMQWFENRKLKIHQRTYIPLDEKANKDELNTIKYLAESNGYDLSLIHI